MLVRVSKAHLTPVLPSSPMLITPLASDAIIDQAWHWLCKARAGYHYNEDIWHLRLHWARFKPVLQARLLAGQFRFGCNRRLRGGGQRGEITDLWDAEDALVLKALALVLTPLLKPHLSDRCFHLAGCGGLKAAVCEVAGEVGNYPFVFRTDVKSYYASIDHDVLLSLLGQWVDDAVVLDLLRQYMQRVVCEGGVYTSIEIGISLGCPLSPLMGAVYLQPLDARMAAMGCFYVRYMDDWVVLAPTRWKLRVAIKAVNEVMADLRVVQHPDKTFIGRVAKGFDFLGYQFGDGGLGVARKTVARSLEKIAQL